LNYELIKQLYKTKIMNNFFGQLRQKLSKPLLFGLFGAVGCFGAAIGGEILLAVALPPSAQPLPPLPQVDVMFVLDVTGSMGGEIRGVQQGIQSFAREISSRKLDGQVGLIAFRDLLEGEEPQILSFDSSVFTSNSEMFGQQVSRLLADGGGDDPESSLDALVLAAHQPFRPQATKVIVLITDALPKIPDKETPSLPEAVNVLRDYKIDQLHMVIQSSDQAAFEGLQASTPGEVFLLSEAASGREGFERILPVVGERIAETTIKGLQSNREFSTKSFGRLVVVISVWTGILTIGVALALIAGQNYYLRRRILTISEAFKGTSGSLIAGFIAGVAGQILFLPVASIPILVNAGRLFGWTILGSFVGGGMSFFVPNLQRHRALQGGAIGGAVGSIGFLIVSAVSGDLVGRLVGAAIIGFFIGLMIALIEQFSRQSWLVVSWTPTEQTKINLGAEPVLLGSSEDAHIYLRKDQGYPSVTAKIYLESGKIVMQFDEEMQKLKGMKILRHELANGDRRKVGDVMIEVKTATESDRNKMEKR
jgi:Ca-activated chloride channel family protein